MPTIFGRRPETVNAIPGLQEPETLSPDAAALLMASSTQRVIGEDEIAEASATLAEYKRAKQNLETRVVQDEMWYKLRHWEAIRGKQRDNNDGAQAQPEPSSAWLFNSLTNKHADAMDNYPEPVVLPREPSDKESAKTLSSVLPVVMEYNEFEQVYSDNWWEKLKHGTAVYGVFWNKDKENGLGDIDIRGIDLLKIFWEPGVTDIQKSRNMFIVELVDEDLLDQQYPEYKGKLKGSTIDVKQYIYDDTIDTSKKSVVVDWYYKRKMPNGRTVLHYCKFVGNTLLYASENDPQYQQTGWYDHGLYPVVFDCLWPEKGTPVGFGYVAICKDPQLYIDKLSANILESSMMATKKRFFVSSSTSINEEELKDWNKPIVHVEGTDLSDARIKELVVQPLDSVYLNIVQMKVEEMKDTASNRDVNSGGYGSGVTAAAAIAALQEAGNKASRDMIAAAYRAYVNVAELSIELMRQFYDEERAFRITAPGGGDYEFVTMDNSTIKDQPIGMDPVSGAPLFRKPVFDLKIKAQKKNPFSRIEQNELSKELYSMGFFNPQKAQEAMIALDLMDFEGIEDVKTHVSQGETLLNICQQLQQENTLLKALVTAATGQPVVGGSNPSIDAAMMAGGENAGQDANGASNDLARALMQAEKPTTGYGQRLAARSVPNMNRSSNSANPGGR